jgi:hypothetical protein
MLDLQPVGWFKRKRDENRRGDCLADHEDPAEAAARLEAALERIAQQAHKRNAYVSPPESDVADNARIAARLDALIAQLRDALNAATGP